MCVSIQARCPHLAGCLARRYQPLANTYVHTSAGIINLDARDGGIPWPAENGIGYGARSQGFTTGSSPDPRSMSAPDH